MNSRIASNVPNAIFVILNVWIGQKVELRRRIFVSLGFILVLFVVVTGLAKADSDEWQRPFLILVSYFFYKRPLMCCVGQRLG